MPAMPEQHLPLIITTTNTNSNSNSNTNNNNYYSPGDIPPQRTYSRSTSASPPPSPTARRKRTMSSSTSSSASASPILEPRRLSITSPSAAAVSTPHPRSRKATCTSQSHLPEAIPEHHVPEFKLHSSSTSAGAGAYEQDPLQIKAHLTELLNCEQVRNDPIMRQYVQSRLFESELELSMFALFSFSFFLSFFFSFFLFVVFKMLMWMNRASTTKKT